MPLSTVPPAGLSTGTPTRDTSGNLTVTGNVSLTGGTSTLGYGTGSGGTVTQLTNKATAVTLNKPTGQITMNNAALAANTATAFIVNNSLVTANDVVHVNVTSFGAYTAQTQYVGSGVFAIRVTNTTAGSLSEALVINFAIIKGATS